LSGQSDATALVSTVRCALKHTLTFRNLPMAENQFPKTWPRMAILWGKGDSGLSHSGIDEIPVINFPEMGKMRKINFIRQNHVISP
jgi:hypothetical protein